MSRPEDVLEQVLSGELTREEAIRQQPDMEDRLLLLTELTGQLESLPEQRPDAEFRNRARMRLLQHIQDTQQRRRWWHRLVRPRLRLPGWANSISAAAIAVGGLSFGATYASASALPDDGLYPVKRAIEQVQVRLATSDEGRANAYLDLADRRAEEIAATAGELNENKLDGLTTDYGKALLQVTTAVQTLPAPAPALLDKVQAHVASQATELEARALNSSRSRPNVALKLAQAEVAASNVVDHVTLIAEKTGKPGPQDIHLAANQPAAATAAAAAAASSGLNRTAAPTVEPTATKAPAGVLGPAPASPPPSASPASASVLAAPAVGTSLDGQFDRLWNGVSAAPFMGQRVRIQLEVDVANAKQDFHAGRTAEAKTDLTSFISQLQAAVTSHQATQYTAARLTAEAKALLEAVR